MDVPKDFLEPKLSREFQQGLTSVAWESCQEKLNKAFLKQRGLHQDELINFNSYLPEIIKLIKEHVRPEYLDSDDRLHRIDVLHAYFVRPYEEKVGMDNPERALMRAHYEAQVHGLVRYQILKKPDDFQDPEEDDDDEDGDNDDFFNPVFSSDKIDTNQGDNDEEDEEDDDDDDDVVDEAEEALSENEAEEEEDEEEEDEEEEDVDIPDEALEGHEGPKQDLTPSVKLSRHTGSSQRMKPAFFIQRKNRASYSEVVHSVKSHHHIMDIPVWLCSKLCWMSTPYRDRTLFDKPYLLGCNFMVNRNFKVCPYEEYYTNNRVFKLHSDKIEIRSKFYHPSKKFRTNATLKITMERQKWRRGSFKRPPRFMLEIPHQTPKVLCPVTVLAMAYGWSVSDFVDCVHMFLNYESHPVVDYFLQIVEFDTEQCQSQAEALQRMGLCFKKCRQEMVDPEAIASYVSHQLRCEFLPNLVDLERGDAEDHAMENRRKGYLLAEVVAELIQMSERRNRERSDEERRIWVADNKTSYHKKRIDTPGEKMTFLCRKYVCKYAKQGSSKLKKVVEKKTPLDLSSVLNRKLIKLTDSVKNGVFDSKSDPSDTHQNKTQMMITGYTSDDLHMQVQKINKISQKKSNKVEFLLTHPTQTGRVCLYITPENDRCAISRNKSMGCWITALVDHAAVQRILDLLLNRHADELGWTPLTENTPLTFKGRTLVKDVYGGVMGWIDQPLELYRKMRQYRSRGVVYSELGMEWDRLRRTFYFTCDEGRMCRPLLVLEKLEDLIRILTSVEFAVHPDPVAHLIKKGCVEYLDCAEEYCGTVLTAPDWETAVKHNCIYTHMEIHGIFTVARTVSKAFMTFNQAPRRMYTGNMEKRSLSLKQFPDRGTTVSCSLWYAQDPLLSDPVDQALGSRHKEPNGLNILVAVLSDQANIEDSYVFKKSAVDLGLCASQETLSVLSGLGQGCTFACPDRYTRGKAPGTKYHALEADGTPRLGAELKGGDAIIGKIYQKKVKDRHIKRCLSRFLGWDQSYRVVSVDRYPDEPGVPPKIVRVGLLKCHRPDVGNKFYMAHGQKGTVSEIRPDVDMPFVESGSMAGISPDMIINVHSLARTTTGLSLESMWGLARAINPSSLHQYQTMFLGASSFAEKRRVCSAMLREAGFSSTGRMTMVCGKTGRHIKSQIFAGLVNVRVLKHMAQNKLRSRDRGPVNELTRQPTTGKKNYGGQKQGEFMNWNMLGYGVSQMFRNINHECASKFTLYYCTKHHLQAMGCPQTGFYMCHVCREDRSHLVRVPATYIQNLFFQEMYTAGFGHTLVCEKVPQDNIVIDEEKSFTSS